MDNKLCIFSYNSRGFCSLKQNTVKSLVDISVGKLPIICNQENFLLKANRYKINQTLKNFHILFNPAVKNAHDKGRAKNGMFMAIPNSIKEICQDISPGHWRIQAVAISLNKSKLLIINSYFPTDPRTLRFDDHDLLEVLTVIDDIIEKNDFNNLVLTGDINADFIRKSGHVTSVDQFLDEKGMLKAFDIYDVDFTHVYNDKDDKTHISTLDHFFWNAELSKPVIDAGVIHNIENSSDHCPIYCVINYDNLEESNSEGNPFKQRPSWKRASSEEKSNYVNILSEKLKNLNVSDEILCCKNVKCVNEEHLNLIDSYVDNFFNIIEDTAKEALPTPGSKSSPEKNNIVGWNDDVKKHKETAMFWHSIWMSAERPINTQLHHLMKKTRNVYHYMIRKCRRAEEKIKKNKLLNMCLNGDADLFEEVKKMRKAPEHVANTIDGVTEDIPGHFSRIYSELYNSTGDADELARLSEEVDSKINFTHINDVEKVTDNIVKEAAKHLKSSKSDPVFDFSSDCLSNGPDVLFSHLAMIIRTFLIHNHVTACLLLATLVPIIKDKLGDRCSSKNYRSIAISSLVLKVLDWVIIILFGVSLQLDQNQFAYQAGCSTTMCTWAVLETIDFFLRNKSDVFVCTMDMTKAFDLVRHSLLFQKLIKGGLSLIFVRLLIFIYMLQSANVRWNGDLSDFFTLTNGVKQGGVLSAILYCFYCNDLFKYLREGSSGCWINGHYMGILGYSDDNILLAPSRSALQNMLNICEDYAKGHNLKFSTDKNPKKCKTKCMKFLQKNRTVKPLDLCGNPLPWVEGAKHLGNYIENKIDGLKKDMKMKRADYINKNNELIQEFSFCHPKTIFSLNKTYNSHFSGSCLWDLFCRESQMLENTWNTSIRLMFDLPLQTHTIFIEPVSGSPHLKNILIKRFLTFIRAVKTSPKLILTNLLKIICRDVRSVTGSNLRNILLLVNKCDVMELQPVDANTVQYRKKDNKNNCQVEMIKELIEIKNETLAVENFDQTEIAEILDYLCVD